MNLATLPSDIIRQILWTEQQPIESLRLISPRWNSLALEPPSIALKQRLPSVESFRWHIHPHLSSSIVMIIPDRFLEYFGVTRWTKYRRFEGSRWVEVTSPILPATPALFNGFYEIPEREKAVWNSVKRMLRRSSRIKRLIIFPEFSIIRDIMDEVVVEEFIMKEIPKMTEFIGSKMLDVLRSHTIKSLFISSKNLAIDLVKFIPEATRLVPIVKLTVFDESSSYLSDLSDLLEKIPHFNLTINVYGNSAFIEAVAV